MSMTLRLITAPATEPVSVETAKAFLRVDGTSDDTLITALIAGARETCEEISRRAFITQTWEMILDAFPPDLRLTLYRPLLQSVTSVKYYDSDGVEATWTDYIVDTSSDPGVLLFNSLPSVTLRDSGGVVVRYVAGYGSATNVPQRIKDAILGLVAYRYENREAMGVPAYIMQAMAGERSLWLL